MQSINVPQGSLKTQYFYDRIFVSSEVEEEQEAGKKGVLHGSLRL
jgi:hypothetical protein